MSVIRENTKRTVEVLPVFRWRNHDKSDQEFEDLKKQYTLDVIDHGDLNSMEMYYMGKRFEEVEEDFKKILFFEGSYQLRYSLVKYEDITSSDFTDGEKEEYIDFIHTSGNLDDAHMAYQFGFITFDEYVQYVLYSKIMLKNTYILMRNTEMLIIPEVFEKLWKFSSLHIDLIWTVYYAERDGKYKINSMIYNLIEDTFNLGKMRINTEKTLARLPKLSERTYYKLFEKQNIKIMVSLSNNPNTPQDILEEIETSYRHLPSTRSGLATTLQNPEILSQMYKKTSSSKLRRQIESNQYFRG